MSRFELVLWLRNWARQMLAVYWLALAVASHWPRFELPIASLGIWQFDKAMHVVAFAVLTRLLVWSEPLGRSAPSWANGVAAMLIAAVYAVIDEWTQNWFGRQVSLSDLVASQIGVLSIFLLLHAPEPAPRARPGLVTAARGAWLLLALLSTVTALYGQSESGIGQPQGSWSGQPFDGLRQVLVAAVLTGLLAGAQPAGRPRPRLGVLVTILVTGLGAPMIQTVQVLTGQGADPADVYAHQIGLLAALVLWALVVVLRWRTHAQPASRPL